jgi:hypothetical protein
MPERMPNPNHHLWNNNGVWFINYTVYPTPFTKERIRRSMQTKDIEIARERRDRFLEALQSSGVSFSHRPQAAVTTQLAEVV